MVFAYGIYLIDLLLIVVGVRGARGARDGLRTLLQRSSNVHKRIAHNRNEHTNILEKLATLKLEPSRSPNNKREI